MHEWNSSGSSIFLSSVLDLKPDRDTNISSPSCCTLAQIICLRPTTEQPTDFHFPLCLSCPDENILLYLCSKHFLASASLGVYKQPECLALLENRLDWVRLIPERFVKNTEFQRVDCVTARLIEFVSEDQLLEIHRRCLFHRGSVTCRSLEVSLHPDMYFTLTSF